jgi:hypothetical protein
MAGQGGIAGSGLRQYSPPQSCGHGGMHGSGLQS